MKYHIAPNKVDFEPVTIKLTIESEKELQDIFQRLNCGSAMDGAPKNLNELCYQIQDIMDEREIDPIPEKGIQIKVSYEN